MPSSSMSGFFVGLGVTEPNIFKAYDPKAQICYLLGHFRKSARGCA